MAKVRLEEVIYLLPNELITLQREGGHLINQSFGDYEIPENAPNKVPPEHYHGYRRGKVGACADILAWTHTAEGEPAAILTFRKKGVCFEQQWWMQGGAIDAFAPIADFVARCAQNESGSHPNIEALVGFFRTTEFIEGDERRQVSTIQAAYLGYVQPERLQLRADENHESAVLMTQAAYASVPDHQKHWYPTLLMKTLFATMPRS